MEQVEVEQKKFPLAPTEILLSLKYDFESKASTSFFLLPLYTSSFSILLLLTPLSIDSLPHYNMSQHGFLNQNLLQIKQQIKQIIVLQALLVARGGIGEEEVALKSDTRLNIEVDNLPILNRSTIRFLRFITACRL